VFLIFRSAAVLLLASISQVYVGLNRLRTDNHSTDQTISKQLRPLAWELRSCCGRNSHPTLGIQDVCPPGSAMDHYLNIVLPYDAATLYQTNNARSHSKHWDLDGTRDVESSPSVQMARTRVRLSRCHFQGEERKEDLNLTEPAPV